MVARREPAGIAESISTHTGRRTVVTTPFVEGGEALEDIGGFVGHANAATSAGYVRRLGRRPDAVSKRAAGVLDRKGQRQAKKVPNHSPARESNRESNRRGRPEKSGADDGA